MPGFMVTHSLVCTLVLIFFGWDGVNCKESVC